MPELAWSIDVPDNLNASLAIGDIDGDNNREIIVVGYDGKVHALHAEDGKPVSGWPKHTGSRVTTTPCITDIDGDGLVEVAVGSEDCFIYVWDTDGVYDPKNIDWGMYQHNARHTGQYYPPDWQLKLESVLAQEVAFGQTLGFTLNAEYNGQKPLTYRAINLPEGASFDAETRTFTWTPTNEQQGTHNIRFLVTDGFLRDLEEVVITVNNAADNATKGRDEAFSKIAAKAHVNPQGLLYSQPFASVSPSLTQNLAGTAFAVTVLTQADSEKVCFGT